MNFAMGFIPWVIRHKHTINRLIIISLLIFDTYLAGLIYDFEPFEKIKASFSLAYEKYSSTDIAPAPSIQPEIEPSPASSPTSSVNPSPSTTSTPSTAPSQAPQTPSPSSTSPTAPSHTPTPTPTPTPTSEPTPTPTATPSPSPIPSESPAQNITSIVYITGYFYENNNQYVAQQYPVSIKNTDTNELIGNGETSNDGKSPSWSVPANTNISVTLFPRVGTLGCGQTWSINVGPYGTLQTTNLSIQSGRTPCISL